MKFLVDSLPYYGDNCPLFEKCWSREAKEKCPRFWDKCKVCSDENPHECECLIEQKREKYD